MSEYDKDLRRNTQCQENSEENKIRTDWGNQGGFYEGRIGTALKRQKIGFDGVEWGGSSVFLNKRVTN